jgi:hypothetical protein
MFYYGSMQLKIGIYRQHLVKIFIFNLKKICPKVHALILGHRQTDRHNIRIRHCFFFVKSS